jgi:hypothetical protein
MEEPRLARREAVPDALIEQVLVGGDLAQLTPAQRARYYLETCRSLRLNPLTRPFEYLNIGGKLTLYARKDATDQLRRLHGISVEIVDREQVGDLYVVRARATAPDGRVDEATGAVSIAGLKGEQLGNAVMRAETKSKRRVTLSIVGLGWTDESELDGLPRARVVSSVVAEGEGAEAVVVEALPAPRPGADEPQRRAVEAMYRACARAGVSPPPLPEGAGRGEIDAWLQASRAELRARGQQRPDAA